jgi:GNAT superfamily N-acetyltransferase
VVEVDRLGRALLAPDRRGANKTVTADHVSRTAQGQTAPRAVVIEPLEDGDTGTVEAVFRQLGPQTRRWRFGAPKPRLSADELALLTDVGSGRLVLVARAGRHPIGLAHLVREPETTAAEVAIVVADPWQRLGVGIALARRLAAEAAAAGIVHAHALIAADNRASLALMRTVTTIVDTRFEGADLYVVGRLPAGVLRRSLRDRGG